MAEESFLLMNLKEEQAKKLAQVMSNDSCRKILDFLTHNDKTTESQLSEELKIPISTVHYNLQHLQKSKLVKVDEFHYSKKGKEVNHYKLAKKFIIIAPEESSPGLMDKLKSILPLGIFAIIGAGIIQIYQYLQNKGFGLTGYEMVTKSTDFASNSRMAEAVPQAMQTTNELVQTTSSEPNIALWFLAGSVFMMLIILIFNLIKKK